MQKFIASIKKYPFQTGIIVGILACLLFCAIFGLFNTKSALLEKNDPLLREDYLRMSIGEFGVNKDSDAAAWRFSRLGKKAKETLKLLIKDKATPSETLFSFAESVGAEAELLDEAIVQTVAQGGNKISMKHTMSPFSIALLVILGVLILIAAFIYLQNMNYQKTRNRGSSRQEQPMRVADPDSFTGNSSSVTEFNSESISELLASFDEDEYPQPKADDPKPAKKTDFKIDSKSASYVVDLSDPAQKKNRSANEINTEDQYEDEDDDDFTESFRRLQEKLNQKKRSEDTVKREKDDPFSRLQKKLEESYEGSSVQKELPEQNEPPKTEYANVNSISPDDEKDDDLLANFLKIKDQNDQSQPNEDSGPDATTDDNEASGEKASLIDVFFSGNVESEQPDNGSDEESETSANSVAGGDNKDDDLFLNVEPPAHSDVESGEPYLVHTETTYIVGEDFFDETFSIEEGENFLGECGISIGETLNNNEPKAVTAFEIWLFDRRDVHTPTCYLLSEFASDNPGIRDRLEQRGETFLIQKNRPLSICTPSLILEFTVTDLEYGNELPEEKSYFEKVTIEIKVRRNE